MRVAGVCVCVWVDVCVCAWCVTYVRDDAHMQLCVACEGANRSISSRDRRGAADRLNCAEESEYRPSCVV